MEQPLLLEEKPTSEGMANVLRRAAQLAQLRWTPLADMPMTAQIDSKSNPQEPTAFFKAWRPQTGLPYSSVRLNEKFIGFNVSLETFITALANPLSVLYTRNLTGQGKRMSCWYGAVCSSFVSYALQLPFRRPCSEWGKHGDMVLTDVQSCGEIRLCDILCSKTHAALVTGVARDANGCVLSVTVTESTRPLITTTEFLPEEFDGYWMKDFRVYRYTKIDGVCYTPSPYVPLEGDPELKPTQPNRTLLPNFGNRSNYLVGETVEFNVMQSGWDRLIVMDESETVFEQRLDGVGVAAFNPPRRGFYRAFCTSGGERSEEVAFAAVDIQIDCAQSNPGQEIRLAFSLPREDRLVSCTVANAFDGFTAAGIPFSEEDARRRSIGLSCLPAGSYRVRALAQNAYGLYASRAIDLEIIV